MPRYKLTLEYDGAPYVGWQRQDNGPSVQGELERAIHAFCGQDVAVHGAGRTDAGVHARGQVAHFDMDEARPIDKIRDGLNFHMKPEAIAVLSAELVDDDFHARFSATRRTYLYRIVNRRAPLALDRGHAWFVPRPLDVEAMAEAAKFLIGFHDFSAFRAAECQANSPEKTLDLLQVSRAGEEICFDVRARSFLHHQVRNFVGTLRVVGEGKRPPEWIGEILASRDRRLAGATAPADGLYLMEVGYQDT